jgi:hypothetical protein
MRRTKLHFLYLAAAGIVSLAVLPSTASAFSCYRHIYNNSQRTWIPSGAGDHGNFYVWMDNPNNANCKAIYCPRGKLCQLTPGCTAEYQMTTTGGRGNGTIYFKDMNGGTKQFGYDFETQCPHIYGDGHGVITTNAPANGDFKIAGNNW